MYVCIVLLTSGKESFKERKGITAYIERVEFEALNEIKWRERKTESEIIRLAISEYIQKHGEGNDTYPLENWQQDPSFQAVPAFYSDQQKWVNHYKNSNDRDRTNLRVKAMNIQKWFRMVDTNP